MNDQLYQELEKIQNENLALYHQLTTLHQQKYKKETSDQNPDNQIVTQEQVDDILAKQKHEELNRSNSSKRLQELIHRSKVLHDEIDKQNILIQRDLMPRLQREEANLEDYYKNIIKKCQKEQSADISNLQSLIDQLISLSKEVFMETEEIEKLKRMIDVNETHSHDLDDPDEPEEQCLNPLPCITSSPQSLEIARSKRKSFPYK